MEIVIKVLEVILASLVSNLIATNIVVAGWVGVMNSALAGLLICLFGSYVGKRSENLEGSMKKFSRFVSGTLMLVAWSVFSVGIIYSWALANQPVNDGNFSEVKQSNEVIANEQKTHESL